MREELVDAHEDVRPPSAFACVALRPGRAAFGVRVPAADAYPDLHLLRLLRVDRDRMQPHPAEARDPLRARGLVVEALHDRPRLAAVLTLEERRRLGAGPHDVRRLRVSRLDVPGLIEGAVRPFRERGILRRLPGFSHVAADLDARATPCRVHGRVHGPVARVVGGVVNRCRGELGPLAWPRTTSGIAAQDEKALLGAYEQSDLLRHDRSSLLTAR